MWFLMAGLVELKLHAWWVHKFRCRRLHSLSTFVLSRSSLLHYPRYAGCQEPCQKHLDVSINTRAYYSWMSLVEKDYIVFRCEKRVAPNWHNTSWTCLRHSSYQEAQRKQNNKTKDYSWFFKALTSLWRRLKLIETLLDHQMPNNGHVPRTLWPRLVALGRIVSMVALISEEKCEVDTPEDAWWRLPDLS